MAGIFDIVNGKPAWLIAAEQQKQQELSQAVANQTVAPPLGSIVGTPVKSGPVGANMVIGGVLPSGPSSPVGGVLGTILTAAQPLIAAGTARLTSSIAGSPASAFTSTPQDVSTGVSMPPMQNGSCSCNYGCGAPSWVPRTDYLGTPACDDRCYPRLYYHKNAAGDPEPRCGKPRRKPRMNPLNPRAAGRAARRLAGAGKAMKRIRKSVNAAARELK